MSTPATQINGPSPRKNSTNNPDMRQPHRVAGCDRKSSAVTGQRDTTMQCGDTELLANQKLTIDVFGDYWFHLGRHARDVRAVSRSGNQQIK